MNFQICPAPIIIMKYDEKPHAIAANKALYHLNLRHRHIMKKPAIIANSRLAGDGRPSVYTLQIQPMAFPAGYDGAIWKLGIPPNSEFVQRVVSPVAS